MRAELNICRVLSVATMSTNKLNIVDCAGKILTENQIKAHVEELRKLLLEDPSLKKYRTDDGFLLRSLHCTDFDVPAAFKKIQEWHNLFLAHPDWFASCPPLEKKIRLEDNDKALLKERDKQGRQIYIVKLGRMNTTNSCPQEQAQLFEFFLELALDDPKTQATGVSVILDMQDYSWKLFKWLTPLNIKVSTKKIDLYPCKEFVFHIVNTSFLVNASIKIVWPFLSERLKKMIKFHFENWPSLHEYINPAVLPVEYGGTGPDVNFEKSIQILLDKNSEIGERLKYLPKSS